MAMAARLVQQAGRDPVVPRRSRAAAWLVPLALAAAPAAAQTSLLRIRGSVPSDGYGYSTATLGDVDGDGWPELIVGSWLDATAGVDAGRVRIVSTRDGSVLRTHYGAAAGDTYGYNMAGVGDLDGDAIPDYVVTAPQSPPSSWPSSGHGYAEVRSGASGALLYTLTGTQADSFYGLSLGPVGDVDGDGAADFAIAAWWQDTTAIDAGECFVHSGVDGALLWSHAAGTTYTAPGNAVDTLGDIDGDGHDDFAIGIFGEQLAGTQRGRVLVVSGKSFGTIREHWGGVDDAFGSSVAGAGDLDGDGIGDLLVGSNNESVGFAPGEAHVYSGKSGEELYCLSGEANGDLFGYVVDGLGDLDGDGLADFLVTSFPQADWTSFEFVGRCRVYSGRRGAVLFDVSTGLVNDFFGLVAGAIGDVDGDGRAEWFVGAPGSAFDFPPQPGAIHLFTSADRHANWTNYGAGWPGTLGVPELSAAAPPALGESVDFTLGNSRGVATSGLLLIGAARDAVVLPSGATLLVAAPFSAIALPLAVGGVVLQEEVPGDLALLGLVLDAQLLVLDPGATGGIAFSEGLELELGGL